MTRPFQIIAARPYHCGAMVRRLRTEHASAIARLGLDSHRELAERFAQSAWRRAWLVDGELAALAGVTGSQLSAQGLVWLALSKQAVRYPLGVVREAKQQLDELMAVKRLLVTTLLDEDLAAQRFAIFLGFTLASEEGAQPAASRAGRRIQMQRAALDPEARVALGQGSALAFAYRGEREMELA